MIALSVRQPWVFAILRCGKNVENRRWILPTRFRGARVLLHASAGMTRHEYEAAIDCINDHAVGIVAFPRQGELVRGAIVGAVTIAGEIPPLLGPEPHMRGWHATDQYGWQLTDVVELPRAVPCKGSLGFWRVPEDVARKIRRMGHA